MARPREPIFLLMLISAWASVICLINRRNSVSNPRMEACFNGFFRDPIICSNKLLFLKNHTVIKGINITTTNLKILKLKIGAFGIWILLFHQITRDDVVVQVMISLLNRFNQPVNHFTGDCRNIGRYTQNFGRDISQTLKFFHTRL